MAGWNLQVYRDEILYLVEGHIGCDSSPAHPDPMLFAKMQEAQRALLRLAGRRVAETTTGTLSVAAGTAWYTLSGPRLREVRFKRPGGQWVPLVRRDLKALQTMFGFAGEDAPDSGAGGEPRYWAVDDVARKILLLPVPSVSQPNGLGLVYDAGPTPFTRLLNDPSITASTGASSARVVLSSTRTGFATAAFPQIAVGDEFGLVPTCQTDGTSIDFAVSPNLWYTILEADSGNADTISLLLDAPMPTTATGLRFITAQVPDIEQEMPGEWGMAIPDFAAGLMFDLMGDDSSASAIGTKWKSDAAQTVENARRAEQGTGPETMGPGLAMPYLFRRG